MIHTRGHSFANRQQFGVAAAIARKSELGLFEHAVAVEQSAERAQRVVRRGTSKRFLNLLEGTGGIDLWMQLEL